MLCQAANQASYRMQQMDIRQKQSLVYPIPDQ